MSITTDITDRGEVRSSQGRVTVPNQVLAGCRDVSQVYAARLDGDCLEPRLFSGERVIIDPNADLVPDELVVIHPRPPEPGNSFKFWTDPWAALCKIYVGFDAVNRVYLVRQLRPDRTMLVPERRVQAIDRVIHVMREMVPEQADA